MYSITPKTKDNCSNRRQLIVTSCEGSSKECPSKPVNSAI